MNEIELKFQIPAAQVKAIHADIGAAQALPLHAAYFDTGEHRLARHRMALRVRREGDAWVQTFKGAGADAMTRLEENVPVPPPADGRPRPDLSRHGAEVQAALQRVLPQWSPATDPQGLQVGLGALYETCFDRWQADRDSAEGRVQVCLDRGEIRAGVLREPLAELELELLSGHPLAVIAQARTWVARHDLWLDVQSKAMKGTRLSAQAASGHIVAAQVVPAPGTVPEQDDPAGWRAWLSAMLDACAGHGAELATERPGGAAVLTAWRQCIAQLLDALNSSPLLSEALPPHFAEDTRHLAHRLNTLVASGDLQGAQALARDPQTTQWSLDVLSALVGTRLNTAHPAA
ncbi:MAG TPA: CYTH domain-containing protein [Aquabacterium sp.]|uniref:CYTH domain-containing protein n=1 Tax=Aquabacterium sp. TaxID=1872578 RepID=UPI002E35479F|nr:CYTH domain-containing protein [Aquabacterium sp.]HEX5371479.1 CYTH domain-containing protein [Aquabacterium sp.]